MIASLAVVYVRGKLRVLIIILHAISVERNFILSVLNSPQFHYNAMKFVRSVW